MDRSQKHLPGEGRSPALPFYADPRPSQKGKAVLSRWLRQHPQVLQEDLQAQEDEDDTAGQLRLALVPGAEQAAHLHPHGGEQEGDHPDKAAAAAMFTFRKAKLTPMARASMLVATARGSIF